MITTVFILSQIKGLASFTLEKNFHSSPSSIAAQAEPRLSYAPPSPGSAPLDFFFRKPLQKLAVSKLLQGGYLPRGG